MATQPTPQGVRAFCVHFFFAEFLRHVGYDVDALKRVATPPIALLVELRRRRRRLAPAAAAAARPRPVTRARTQQRNGPQRCGLCGKPGHTH